MASGPHGSGKCRPSPEASCRLQPPRARNAAACRPSRSPSPLDDARGDPEPVEGPGAAGRPRPSRTRSARMFRPVRQLVRPAHRGGRSPRSSRYRCGEGPPADRRTRWRRNCRCCRGSSRRARRAVRSSPPRRRYHRRTARTGLQDDGRSSVVRPRTPRGCRQVRQSGNPGMWEFGNLPQISKLPDFQISKSTVWLSAPAPANQPCPR